MILIRSPYQKDSLNEFNFKTMVTISQCANYNILSRFFGKDFVKATHLLKKSLRVDLTKKVIW